MTPSEAMEMLSKDFTKTEYEKITLYEVGKRKPLSNNDRDEIAMLIGSLSEDNKTMKRRLQIDPGGSDRIDELETHVIYLRDEVRRLGGVIYGD